MNNKDKKKGIITEHVLHTKIQDLPIRLVGIVKRRVIWFIGVQHAMKKIWIDKTLVILKQIY